MMYSYIVKSTLHSRRYYIALLRFAIANLKLIADSVFHRVICGTYYGHI